MTTWLPALLIGWVALCTVIFAIDPIFNSNTPGNRGGDRLLGAIVGFLIGTMSGAVFYALMRIGAWLAGGE